jgi:hypothetical protein
MKIRTGFVSNSSSSSFTLAYKPPACQSDVPLEKYMRNLILDSPETTIKTMYQSILLTIVECITAKAKEISVEDWLKEWRWRSDGSEQFKSLEDAKKHDWDYISQTAELFEKGFKIYEGAFGNCDWGAGAFLCYESLNFDTPHLVMMHEGGL